MTDPVFKILPTQTELLEATKDAETGDDVRPVRVIVSTAGIDRMGDIIVQEGIDFSAYKKTNPVVLFNHNSNVIVARAPDIGIVGGKLTATALFPAEGEDDDADKCYGKIKAGLINAASIGFNPTDYEPLDPKQPWAGLKFTGCELLEFSFVSVPANKGCVIIGRSVFASVEDTLAVEEAVTTPEQVALARVMELPKVLRKTAKNIKNKGARGHYLHHANMIEEAVTGVKKGNPTPPDPETTDAEPGADQDETTTEPPAQAPQLAAGFTDIAARRLTTLRHKITA